MFIRYTDDFLKAASLQLLSIAKLRNVTAMNLYRKSFIVRTYEADLYNRLKISSLLNYMQETASEHANGLGFGYQQLKPQNRFWVLSRLLVELKSTITFDSTMIVETWPRDFDKYLAYRDYRFYDCYDRCFASATTAWIMLDSTTYRPVPFDPHEFSIHRSQTEPATAALPDKLMAPEQFSGSFSRTVAYSDLDVNHHVNNAKYAEYIFDCFDPIVLRNRLPSRIQINFLKELKPGSKLEILSHNYSHNPNEWYFEGRTGPSTRTFQAVVLFNSY